MNSADHIAQEALAAINALQQRAPGSIILVGPRAVYLRSVTAPRLPIEPFTHDVDVVADPRRIRKPRELVAALQTAGYVSRGMDGLFERNGASPEEIFATRVDVLVPARFSHAWADGNWTRADKAAALEQPGLELALVDHSPMVVSSAPDSDAYSITIEVAGTSALTVAKAWKLAERHAQGREAFEEVAKDLADVFRLLVVADRGEMIRALAAIPKDPRFREVGHKGAAELRALTALGADGHELFVRTLGGGEDARLWGEQLAALADEFDELVRETL